MTDVDATKTRTTTVEVDKTEGELIDAGQEDIVVDLPYVELVARLIRKQDVDADPDMERMNPALGLGVVVVQDIKKLAEALEPTSAERNKVLPPKNEPKTNLDKVLVWLRQEFHRIDETWEIALGKSRTVQGVHGTPHIGGGGYPVAADKPEPHADPPPPPKVKVGLIDTRVFPHENFHDRLKFIGRGELPRIQPFNHLDIHGTFTVGLILDQAPEAEVIVKAVLRHDLAKATTWDVASAMTEFIDKEVSLLVLPLVCFTADGEPPLALQRAVTLLRRYGIAVVAAAGNHGENPPRGENPTNNWKGFPAACVGATAVGATNAEGEFKAAFNPHEDETKKPWIALAGPGIKVVSTSVYGEIAYVEIEGIEKPEEWQPEFKGGARWSGTSFATATVGGRIAARIVESGRTAFEVIKELADQSPADHGGIGSYGGLEPPPRPA